MSTSPGPSGLPPGSPGGATLAAAALAAAPFGVLVYDRLHRLAYINEAGRRLARLRPGETPPGITLRDVVRLCAYRGMYGAGDPEAQAAQHLALDRSRPFRRLLRGTDGACLDLHGVPLEDGGLCTVLAEITTHLAAADEAAALAHRLEAVLAQLHGGVAVFDAADRVVLTNPAYEALIGLPRGGARPGMARSEVLRALADRGEFGSLDAEDMIASRSAIDRSRPHAHRRDRPNGQALRFGGQPMPDGGWLVEVTDITHALRAEDEARRRAALLDGVLASMPHGVVVFGADQRVAMVNAAYQSIMTGATIAVGERRDEIARRRALAGEYGPGSTETLIRDDLSEPTDHAARRQRQRPDGRMLDIRYAALPDGGHVQVTTDITALHLAQTEATERARLLQLMLDNMRHGIALFDAEQRLVTSNALAAHMMGLPPEALHPGVTFDSLVAAQQAVGEFAQRTGAEIVAGVVMRDHTKPMRYSRTRPDGTMLEIISDPTPDGGFVRTYGDITARARAETEAREQAAMLQATIDNLRHGIVVYGPDRRVRVANRLSSELAGHRAGAIRPGRVLDDLVRELVREGGLEPGPESDAIVEGALRADRSLSTRLMRNARDGRVLEVHSDPLPDGGFVVSHIDITPLARAEAEARTRAGILQAMLDNIRHGIALFDAEDRVVAANPVFRQLLELPDAVLAPGRPYADFVAVLRERGEYGAGAAGERAAATILGRDRREAVRTIRTRPNGDVLEVVSDPTPDGGWVLTYTDVTEDRRIRAELEAARETAEGANRAKSRFLATMSHELRTPLNAVIGFSEAIIADPEPARVQDYVKSILEAGRHLLGLIDDVLDVARAGTTGFAIAEGAVDITALADASVRVMRAAAATARVSVEATLPAALPLVRADPTRLRQVLLNLLSNAVKFTPAGGSVRLDAAPEPDGGVVLRVTDSGIGMKAEDIPRAFEPFTQLDSALSRRFQGSGLGLYLSRALAEAQGATLTLESVPGTGTTAVLRFPAARLIAPDPAPAISAEIP